MKIFTEEAGLITLMARKPSHALFSPFCIAEWVYRKKSTDIYPLIEGSLIDNFLNLRQSYASLLAAGSMAQDLLRTQLPAKNSPRLYILLGSYFKKVPSFECPAVLASSFRLKLLLHEGLLALQTSCAHCGLEANSLLQGESVCSGHSLPFAIGFSISEWQIIHTLAFAKQFSLLQQIDCPPSLYEKITALFEERTKH